jgi:hypothetical protein
MNMTGQMTNEINRLYEIYKKEQSEIFAKMSKEHWPCFKDNFIARTRYTQLTALKALEVCIIAGKYIPSIFVLENVKEEAGFYGDKSHYEFMIDAFGPSCGSELTEATKEFIAMKKRILNSASRDEVLGNFLAHEMAADGMLKLIKQTFHFDNNAYFDAHSDDNLEARHFDDALEIVQKLYYDEDDIIEAVEEFFDKQLAMFRSILDSK